MAPKAGKTSASRSKGSKATAKAPRGARTPRTPATGDQASLKASKPAKAPTAAQSKKADKAAEQARKAQDEAVREGMKVPEGKQGSDENTGQLRARDVAPPTQTEVADLVAGEAQEKATQHSRFTGRVKDTADGPSEAVMPRTAFPHPYTGTQVDRVGGIAEITHRAGVYGMDSRDYGTRLEFLASEVGFSDDSDMDPRDRWTRLIALHDRIIDATRYGNTVEDTGELLAESGLGKVGAKGKSIDNARDLLAQAGLLPGNL